MIRPFTCICLVLAAGSGLYLYQVKQRAFALDAQLRSTFHDIDVARERTRMLRADWALMNDPERLQALANQYLALKPMGPSQLMTLDQLAVALPAPVAPSAAPPAVPPEATAPATPATPDPTHGVPMAAATPAPATADQAVALLQPPAVSPAIPPAAADPAPVAQGQAASGAPDLAAITVLPPDLAPPPPPAPAPRLAVATPAPVSSAARRTARHVQAAAASRGPVVTQSALAAVNAPHPAADGQKARPAHRAPAPAPAGQLYAANEPVRQNYATPRITPSAATVLYRPVSSSLGMAGSGTLAPPRPLYATTQ